MNQQLLLRKQNLTISKSWTHIDLALGNSWSLTGTEKKRYNDLLDYIMEVKSINITKLYKNCKICQNYFLNMNLIKQNLYLMALKKQVKLKSSNGLKIVKCNIKNKK